MKSPELTVFCNEAATGRKESKTAVKLRTYGPHRNVRLKLDQLGAHLNRNISNRLVDLLEIAAMVYIADQIVHRGANDTESMGASWRRHLRFEISVRDHRFWNSSEVGGALVDLLGFLSEDCYEFQFTKYKSAPALDRYLEFGEDVSRPNPESVMLFSGGLDSLGGVVERVVGGQESAILVSHESSPKLRTRLRALRSMIDAAAGDAYAQHVTVTVNKKDLTEREYTQRSRSFLYAAIATTVARMSGLDSIRFFENGVVSLNLPISPHVIGSRATRTTHPRVLADMRRFFSLVTGVDFGVTNDFIWKTKSDVVRAIVDAGHGAMIPLSTSCTHTWQMRTLRPHCGECSQCIDRRFAVLAGGAGNLERPETYGYDLLTGARSKGESRIMLSSYVESAQQVSQMDEAAFYGRYGEAARAIRHVGLPDDEAARCIFDLYKRHADQVMAVIDDGVANNSKAIRSRSLPESCLVRLVHDPRPSSGAPSTRSTVAAEGQPTPTHRLKRLGEGWDLMYEGNETRLTPRIGLIYIEQLIRYPNKRFSVAELLVSARPEAANLPTAAAEPELDDITLWAFAERLAEIEEEHDKAERDADQASLQRLADEKTQLLAELKRSGFSGRPKTESKDHKRLRDRVCNAIRRAIEVVEKYDNRAGNHFSEAIDLGSTVLYAPSHIPEWDF